MKTSTPLTTTLNTETEIELFPYQLIGAEWLSKRKVALLADEMGLGKSAQAIRAADMIGAKRLLVVCPAIARINWEREFQKFSKTPREFELVRGEKQTVWDTTKSIITSFDACSFVEEPGRFDVLIIDEAHFLKGTSTKRTAAILGAKGICRAAARVWALTGTPAPNHAGELWPLLYTFGVTAKGYDQFVSTFCNVRRTGFGLQIAGTKMSEVPALQKLLSTIMLRRKKEDVMKELPPLNYAHILVERGEVDISQTDTFVQYSHRPEVLAEKLRQEKNLVEYILKNEGTFMKGMRALEALSESVAALRRYTALQKVDAIGSIIAEELENNAYDKIVIFAIHKDVIEGLRRKLEHFGAVTLYGGTPDEKRQKHIDAFQNKPKTRVMLANIIAAGTSVTFTAASQVAFAEQDWVPGNNAQAVMRCHRIGQTRPVFVRVFGLAESFDERISNSLKRKMNELTRLFDIPDSEPSHFAKLTKPTQIYKSNFSDNNEPINEINDFEELLK